MKIWILLPLLLVPVGANAGKRCTDPAVSFRETLDRLRAVAQNPLVGCSRGEICRHSDPDVKLFNTKSPMYTDVMLSHFAVGVEPMREFMKAHNCSSKNKKFAVLDDGYDVDAIDKMRCHWRLHPDMRRALGCWGLPDRAMTFDGETPGQMQKEFRRGTLHGAYSPLSPNKFGFSTGGKVKVYLINSDGTGANFSETKRALERACTDGNRFIVLSYERGGTYQISRFDRELSQLYQKRGCMLVQSAGNPGSHPTPDALNNLPGLMSVGASESLTGQRAKDFKPSRFLAPGTQVPVFSGAPNTRLCGIDQLELRDGSSYAGPITAAVLAQIDSLMDCIGKGKWSGLSKANQLQFLKNVAEASKMGGSINGLRALKMAKLWSKAKSSSIAPAQFRRLLQNDRSECLNEKTESCVERFSSTPPSQICQNIKACMDRKYREAMLCDQVSGEQLSSLFKDYSLMSLHERQYSLAHQLKNRVNGSFRPDTARFSDEINQYLENDRQRKIRVLRLNQDKALQDILKDLGKKEGPFHSSPQHR